MDNLGRVRSLANFISSFLYNQFRRNRQHNLLSNSLNPPLNIIVLRSTTPLDIATPIAEGQSLSLEPRRRMLASNWTETNLEGPPQLAPRNLKGSKIQCGWVSWVHGHVHGHRDAGKTWIFRHSNGTSLIHSGPWVSTAAHPDDATPSPGVDVDVTEAGIDGHSLLSPCLLNPLRHHCWQRRRWPCS
jgi:hypothetical protein